MAWVRRNDSVVLAMVFAAFAIGGCKRQSSEGAASGEQPAGAVDPAAARAEANQIFATRCTPCHGSTGGGDGPASAGLTPRPRNFHDRVWQASVTDGHIEQIIQYGGAAVGKSPAMPPNPDLTERPAVVSALREHVRSLRQ